MISNVWWWVLAWALTCAAALTNLGEVWAVTVEAKRFSVAVLATKVLATTGRFFFSDGSSLEPSAGLFTPPTEEKWNTVRVGLVRRVSAVHFLWIFECPHWPRYPISLPFLCIRFHLSGYLIFISTPEGDPRSFSFQFPSLRLSLQEPGAWLGGEPDIVWCDCKLMAAPENDAAQPLTLD